MDTPSIVLIFLTCFILAHSLPLLPVVFFDRLGTIVFM
jgi:hypothetical protein